MTALPPKAEVHPRRRYVANVPGPEISRLSFLGEIGCDVFIETDR